jgi:hypothetical protein
MSKLTTAEILAECERVIALDSLRSIDPHTSRNPGITPGELAELGTLCLDLAPRLARLVKRLVEALKPYPTTLEAALADVEISE